jgi:initiation factor 1A
MYQTSIRKKKKNFNTKKNENYEINFEYEEYGLVKKLLGNCRVNLITNSGDDVVGVIRGNMRKYNKRVLIEKGDIVVVSKREFQSNKVDIVHKISLDKYPDILNGDNISNTLKNEYYNSSYTSSTNDKDTHINFGGSTSDDSDGESYNKVRFLNIEDNSSNSSNSSDSEKNVDIDNI